MDNKEKIKNILVQIKPQVNFSDEAMILNEGILDSLDIIRLMMELEKGFNIKLSPSNLKKENFINVDTISAFVEEMIAHS